MCADLYVCVDQQSVTGNIVSVLYEKDVRHLRSFPGVWCAGDLALCLLNALDLNPSRHLDTNGSSLRH